MKKRKTLLKERFQQLAGIKPLYEMPKRFHGTAQERRDEFDPFAHVGSEEEFYTQIQRDMKDIYDLDVPMEEIKKWVAGYHFPYSSWDHEKDEPGPKVLAWETEERIDFIEYLREPDSQLGLYFHHLSMGQILCIPLIVFGILIYTLILYFGIKLI